MKNPSLRGKEHYKAITLRSGKQTSELFINSTVATQDTDGLITGEKVESDEFVDASDKEVLQIIIHISIPLVDALVQILSYRKFMKDLLSKKKKLIDIETIAITENYSVVLTNKLPSKLKDPESFTIPYSIGNHYLGKALCDLEASINLMPLSTFRKLGIAHLKSTTVDKEVPKILGQPFLATARTLIDVKKGELTMQLNDDQVTFSVFESIQCKEKEECHTVDVLDDLIKEEFKDQSTVLSEDFAVTSDVECLNDCHSMVEANKLELKHGWQIEPLDLANRTTPIFKPSIKKAPTIELKLTTTSSS
ncbi:uncharacterized protein LOC105762123 [Gossypium raimondii]|uniref:uncharacterized protein LOC105762123 n=1 Tax=Gossypium raimondii TaxID=29730 RepID=UPI00063AF65F|nr:uncharacterized protein LOC105762123 [Gossypium raimondii]